MTKILRFGATVICFGLLTVPIAACSSSSDKGKGSAGEGSVLGNAGATSGPEDSAGATSSNAGATSSNAGATSSNAGTTGSGAGETGSPGGSTGTGTMDAVTECKALYAAECMQAFKCFTADQLAQAGIGATEAECEANLTDCSADTASCSAGETYHGDQAAACVSAVAAQSCADFTADTPVTPAACETVCQ
jgi:hypothetical protein